MVKKNTIEMTNNDRSTKQFTEEHAYLTYSIPVVITGSAELFLSLILLPVFTPEQSHLRPVLFRSEIRLT